MLHWCCISTFKYPPTYPRKLGELGVMQRVRARTVYLADDHASCHVQAGVGGEMRGDEKAEACLWKGELVGVQVQHLIHHHHPWVLTGYHTRIWGGRRAKVSKRGELKKECDKQEGDKEDRVIKSLSIKVVQFYFFYFSLLGIHMGNRNGFNWQPKLCH